MQQILKKGNGWRIGWNPMAEEYRGLIGAQDWAFELKEAEFTDFCRLSLQLADTMIQMAKELMDEEKIACEAESELMWLEVEGFPDSYSLRVILHQGRACEGNWSEEAVFELMEAIFIIYSAI